MKRTTRRNMALVLAAGMMLGTAAPAYAGLFNWGKKTESTASAEEKTEYSFTYNETQIKMNVEAAPIITALGTPEKTLEQDSCAYQGKDTVYVYPGFEMGVYPDNGVNKVSYVTLVNDSVATPEGIKIGSKADDVIQAYGKNYEEQFGVYTYVLGGSMLKIFTTNSVVDGVEYQIAPAK